jgi:hypothetical protein
MRDTDTELQAAGATGFRLRPDLDPNHWLRIAQPTDTYMEGRHCAELCIGCLLAGATGGGGAGEAVIHFFNFFVVAVGPQGPGRRERSELHAARGGWRRVSFLSSSPIPIPYPISTSNSHFGTFAIRNSINNKQ